MATKWTNNKEVNEMIDAVIEQGWRIEQGSKHLKLYPADRTKSMFTVAGSASDYRAGKNIRAQIRRAGGIV